ncbi:hypothetical protein KEM52_001384 [Ascosphaera acerosa]|nr:hypothetical protein KEM52_001384 [Ascosphaera acerosa]
MSSAPTSPASPSRESQSGNATTASASAETTAPAIAKPFRLSSSIKIGKPRASVSTRASSQSSLSKAIHSRASSSARLGLDEDEEALATEKHGSAQQQELTAFVNGTAVTADREEVKGPLVIAVPKTNNWRDRVQARSSGRTAAAPHGGQSTDKAATGDADGTAETLAATSQYGLIYAAPSAPATAAGAESETLSAETPAQSDTPLSQDEAALQALITESKDDGGMRKSTLVIPAAAPPPQSAGQTYDETRSFREDVASRPDPASLASYEAVPVEEFGAALLRGMGWKEGQAVGKSSYGSPAPDAKAAAAVKPRVLERRPGFLGIGAKAIPGKGGDLEIGAWGKAAMRKAKGGSGEGLYTPVVLRNKRTGETIAEDEFRRLQEKQKLESQRRVADEEIRSTSKRRDRSRGRSSQLRLQDRDAHSDGDNERDGRESSRHRHSHRHRSTRDRERERDDGRSHTYSGDYHRHTGHERTRHATPSDRRSHRNEEGTEPLRRDRETDRNRSSRHSEPSRGYRRRDDSEHSERSRDEDRRRYDRRRPADDDRDRKRSRRY